MWGNSSSTEYEPDDGEDEDSCGQLSSELESNVHGDMWGGSCLGDNDDVELDNSTPSSAEVGRRSTSYRGVVGVVEANFKGPVMPAKAESRGKIRGRGM